MPGVFTLEIVRLLQRLERNSPTMPLQPAARLNDPIAHTSMLAMIGKVGAGLVVGAVVGAAVTVAAAAVVGATVATGGVAGVVATAVVGSVLMEVTGAGELIGAGTEALSSAIDDLIPPVICGHINDGSPNVSTNSLPAARAIAEGDSNTVLCERHGAPQYVAEGSETVFINSVPATRVGDRTTCDAKVALGSDNVVIGGPPVQMRDIDSEMPAWLEKAGLLIGVATALCTRNWKSIPSKLACLGVSMGIGMAADAAVATAFGHPVHAASGGKLLDGRDDTDFALPARLPLVWRRRYSSLDTREGLFGRGWSVPVSVQLRVNQVGEHPSVYIDEQGREVPFTALKPGQSLWNTAEGYRLACTPGGHFVIEGDDGVYRDFGPALVNGPHTLAVQRLEDRNGNAIGLRYDDDGRLEWLNDSAGRLYTCRYDARHPRRLAAIALHAAADSHTPEVDAPAAPVDLVRYAYDANGRLSTVTDRLGHTTRRFTWCDEGPGIGLLASHSLPQGLTCHYQWEGFADHPRVVKHWSDDGQHWFADYDLIAGQTRVVDHLGRQQSWRWNSRYQITAHTDAVGATWTLSWNDAAQLIGCTQPNGGRWRFAYDAAGNLSAQTNPLGHTRRIQWKPGTPLPERDTDEAGAITRYTYDPRGNLIEQTGPRPEQCTRISYDRHGQPIARQDAHGGYSQWQWNRAGQPIVHTDCSGQRTRYSYDANGHLAAITDAAGHTTAYRHDALGRLCEARLPDGSRRNWDWDGAGQLLRHIDGNGGHTLYDWNRRGQLTRRIDAADRAVDYHYDAAGNLSHLVNENRQAYRFDYDPADRLIARTGLDGVRSDYTLDLMGWPIAVRQAAEHPEEIRLALTRDLMGRLIEKTTPETRTWIVYDPAGRPTELTRHSHPQDAGDDPQGAFIDRITLDYDDAGQLIGEHYDLPLGGGHRKHALVHEYDLLGNRTALRLPQGRQLNFLHYGAGHLHQINLDGEVVTDIERDALHREVLRSQGRLESASHYDALSRKTGHWCGYGQGDWDKANPIRLEGLIHKDFSFDANGELTARRDDLLGEVRYRYDVTGRLLQTTSSPTRGSGPQTLIGSSPSHAGQTGGVSLDEVFAYDAAANLVTPANTGGRIEYNRLTVFEDKRYTYDVHGRLTGKRIGQHTEQRFRYNSEHQLIEARTRRNGLEQTVTYRYDAFGRRIAKSDRFGTTTFIWDGPRLLQEWRGQRCITYVYHPGSHEPLARIDSEGTTPTQPPLLPAHLLGEAPEPHPRGGATIYYFHNHINGAPEELTDSQGQIVWRGRHRSWGNLALEEVYHPDLQHEAPPGGITAPQSLRFQGQYADEETGLHYNLNRYYDPDIGRFITEDPIHLAGGVNLYQYADNPLTWIDPWGLAGYNVSAQTAGTDALARGVHVNVNGPGLPPRGGHVGMVPNATGDGLNLVPADKATSELSASQWNKAQESVKDYLDKPANLDRMSKAAQAGIDAHPDSKRATEMAKVRDIIKTSQTTGRNPCR